MTLLPEFEGTAVSAKKLGARFCLLDLNTLRAHHTTLSVVGAQGSPPTHPPTRPPFALALPSLQVTAVVLAVAYSFVMGMVIVNM